MFCYQRSFGQPTEVVSKEQFRALITAPETSRKVKEAREALARGDKNVYDNKKKGLPFVIFIATYDESGKEFENKQTGEKTTRRGQWRNQKYCRLNGLCVIDFDHVEGDVRKVWEEAFSKLSDEDKAKILFVFVTPSGHGLKVVFMADASVGNLIDNQIVFSRKLGLNPDESCKDGSRGAFLTTEEDIILLDERIITYENPEFGEKYNEAYHEGKTQATITNTNSTNLTNNPSTSSGTKDSCNLSDPCSENNPSNPSNSCSVKELVYHGVPYSKIIEAWIGDKKVEQGDRHRTSLVLADHLRYITDNDPKLIEQILRQTPFVQEIVDERGEDVAQTVQSAQGYEFLKGIPRRMQNALKAAGVTEACSDPQPPNLGGSVKADDVYAVLPLDKWAEELQEMAQYYPCLKELFVNVHPHKLPAVWFSSAALFGTLMTRAYYHFWYEPEIVRRLNYCIFIIGDPGAGKNIVEKFYKKIADPMIQADSCLIDAVNRYKEGRTERTTSTKAQKGEALKRPVVGIRVHPARTATGEFIRHMNAAIETVEG